MNKWSGQLGILGGTFDPVQIAHLVIGEVAWDQLRLDRVVFVPAGNPWRKGTRIVSPAWHRLAMVRLAVAGNEHFDVSPLEVERPGPSYTVDTLTELRKTLGPDTGLYFIVGLDALFDLPNWKEPQRLIQLSRLAVVARRGYSGEDLRALESQVPGLRERVTLVDAPLLDMSSSDIRRRVCEGLPIRYLVPDAVEAYIHEHGLYREPDEADD